MTEADVAIAYLFKDVPLRVVIIRRGGQVFKVVELRVDDEGQVQIADLPNPPGKPECSQPLPS